MPPQKRSSRGLGFSFGFGGSGGGQKGSSSGRSDAAGGNAGSASASDSDSDRGSSSGAASNQATSIGPVGGAGGSTSELEGTHGTMPGETRDFRAPENFPPPLTSTTTPAEGTTEPSSGPTASVFEPVSSARPSLPDASPRKGAEGERAGAGAGPSGDGVRDVRAARPLHEVAGGRDISAALLGSTDSSRASSFNAELSIAVTKGDLARIAREGGGADSLAAAGLLQAGRAGPLGPGSLAGQGRASVGISSSISSSRAGTVNPEERATRAALEKAEAEKRLKEAEQRLRAAVEELYNKHHKRSDRYSAVFDARHPLCHHGDSCVANAVGSLCQSFLLAYSVRVGVGVLLRAFKLLRNRSFRSVLDLQLLLSEKNLIVREEAVRMGLLFGGFSGVYHVVRCILRRCLDRDTPSHSFVAGAVSGLCLFALDDPQKRRSLALYLLARLGQCFVNSPRAKASLGRWLPQWEHGGLLLFCLSSAQIMYAFVMRPETLPNSYFDFIEKTGPVSGPVVEAVRRSVRGLPVDPVPLSSFIRKATRGAAGQRGKAAHSLDLPAGSGRQPLGPMGLGPHPPIIPCSVLHPREASCWRNELLVLRETFRKTFPLYLSLTFVPFVVLNMQKFMQSPLRTAWLASRSAVRSTAFLSLFVGIYQAVICLHRQVAIKDHKLLYWLAGSMAGLSALVEKPSRRTELALYTLPRAADSLWYILVNVHLLPDIKYAEVALFCLCLGGVVYYHEHEPGTMAPFLRGIITRFLKGTGSPYNTADAVEGPAPAAGGAPSPAAPAGGVPPPAAAGASQGALAPGAAVSAGAAGRKGQQEGAQRHVPGSAPAAPGRGEGPERPEGQQDWTLTAQRLEAAFQGL